MQTSELNSVLTALTAGDISRDSAQSLRAALGQYFRSQNRKEVEMFQESLGVQIDPQTLDEIGVIRKRWADEKRREQEEREAEDRDTWARLKAALLQGAKPFLPPCECDGFLAAVLEDRKPECAHYDGSGLFWWLQKQGF